MTHKRLYFNRISNSRGLIIFKQFYSKYKNLRWHDQKHICMQIVLGWQNMYISNISNETNMKQWSNSFNLEF